MVRVVTASGRLVDISCLQLAAPSLHSHCARRSSQLIAKRSVCVKASNAEDLEPDWETEMSIFKKRTMKPSQMEALRKLEEEKVDVGRVSHYSNPIKSSVLSKT